MPDGPCDLSVLSNACVPLLPQEFYELTLMDECKTSSLKTSEALEMASRWEMSQRPFAKSGGGPSGPAGNSVSAAEQVGTGENDRILHSASPRDRNRLSKTQCGAIFPPATLGTWDLPGCATQYVRVRASELMNFLRRRNYERCKDREL